MTASEWDERTAANVLTMIPGGDENTSDGGRAENSAIPAAFDSWFHGDFRRSLPETEAEALGEKTLEEYDRPFPNYRVKTAVEVGLDTRGKRVRDYEIRMAEPSELSAITLEGGPGEFNPYRTPAMDYDGEQDYLMANQKGPVTARTEVGPVDGVEGVRGSIIFGGNDTYIVKSKQGGLVLPALWSGEYGGGPAAYYLTVPSFYAFVDAVAMADGTTLVRVWDASVYPAHALYVGGERVDATTFREGVEWNRLGPDPAFDAFSFESTIPGRTPFETFGSFGYEQGFRNGFGDHPVLTHAEDGKHLTAERVEAVLPEPLVPDFASD